MKNKPQPVKSEPKEPELCADGRPTISKILAVLDMRQLKGQDMNQFIMEIEECYDIRRAIKRGLKKETDPDVVEWKDMTMEKLNK